VPKVKTALFVSWRLFRIKPEDTYTCEMAACGGRARSCIVLSGTTKYALFIYYFQFYFCQFSLLEWVKWLSSQRHLIVLRVLAIVADNVASYWRNYICIISINSTKVNLKLLEYICSFILYCLRVFMSVSISNLVNVNHSDSRICILDNAKISVVVRGSRMWLTRENPCS